MRVLGQFLAIVCACGTIAASGQTAADKAAKVLAEARTALGGEQKIAAVKTFTTTGRTRRVQGDNLVPIEFEIAVELPDKYVRKDEIPAQESDPSTQGFNGDALVQIPPPTPPEPRPGMPPPPPAQFENMLKQRVLTVKQDFARLMLGMFATSYSAYPLTFAYVATAEAPEGKADVLEATGPNNFKIRLFVHSQTHLPIMVSWLPPARPAMPGRMGGPGAPMPMPPGRGAPVGPPTAPPGAQPPGAQPPPTALPGGSGAPGTPPALPGTGTPPASAPMPTLPGTGAQGTQPPTGRTPPLPGATPPGTPATPPESRLYFSDYREVDGLQLPFRLRRGLGTNTTEETTFDRFRINTKIDPRKFEVRK